MRGRKKVKRGIVLLLLFLTVGLFFQPLQASEMQCGIWCPGCAKWQENFTGKVPDSAVGRGNKEIIVSCKDCGRKLIEVTKWVETATYNSDTDEESSSWWEQYTVSRGSSDVVFPQAAAYSEGGSDSDDSYRVTADGNVFGTTGYGWTTQDIFNAAYPYLSNLFTSLYNCANGDFTWKDWYNSGLSTNASGVKNSPLISYMSKFGTKAVLQEELTPPVLSVTGDAVVEIYRAGVPVEGDMKAGDTVQITPVKIAGREYTDYTISENAENVSWQNDMQLLSFVMPAGEVNVEVSYWNLKELSVGLTPLFYETYQKEPYWDGDSFNLDCEPPITIQNEMLHVKAVVQHSRTNELQEWEVPDFTITSGSEIINLGENPVTVTADVFGDGYVLEGSCVIRADSVALKELMKETESETYTELKIFVESLVDNLADYEQMIDKLSKDLEISETQRTESERKLAEALAEVDILTEKLEESREQFGELSAELESLSAELATVKETLTAMQEFLQEITGTEEIDKDLLEKAKEEFEELKNQKESLLTELEKLTEKNQSLTEKNQNLSERNENLAERNESLAERIEKLSEENEILQNKLERVMTDNTELAEQLKYTLEEQQLILGEYELLKSNYAVLQEKNNGLGEQIAALLQENTAFTEKVEVLEIERKNWQNKYELLLAEQTAEKNETKKEETGRTAVDLTEMTTQIAIETAETEKEPLSETATKPEQELDVEKGTLAEVVTKETMTSTETPTTEEIKKEEADYQSAGIGSGRRLLPGIATVIAAMLLGGVVLYFALEQKELPFKIENLKNLG